MEMRLSILGVDFLVLWGFLGFCAQGPTAGVMEGGPADVRLRQVEV